MGQLSDALREGVRTSGESLNQIANAIDISDGILSRFMRAERSMNIGTAEKLAEYLELELRPVKRRKE